MIFLPERIIFLEECSMTFEECIMTFLECSRIALITPFMIDLGSILDGRYSGGESKRVQGLIEVGLGRGHTREHDGESVPSQSILQQTSELRVSVWDVGGML